MVIAINRVEVELGLAGDGNRHRVVVLVHGVGLTVGAVEVGGVVEVIALLALGGRYGQRKDVEAVVAAVLRSDLGGYGERQRELGVGFGRVNFAGALAGAQIGVG